MGCKECDLVNYVTKQWHTSWHRTFAAGILAAVALTVTFLVFPSIGSWYLWVDYGDCPYGGGIFFGMLVSLFLAVFCIPVGETWYTKYGRRSLYAYVLHWYFLVQVLSGRNFKVCEDNSDTTLGCDVILNLGFVIFSIGVATLLSSYWLEAACEPLLSVNAWPWNRICG